MMSRRWVHQQVVELCCWVGFWVEGGLGFSDFAANAFGIWPCNLISPKPLNHQTLEINPKNLKLMHRAL